MIPLFFPLCPGIVCRVAPLFLTWRRLATACPFQPAIDIGPTSASVVNCRIYHDDEEIELKRGRRERERKRPGQVVNVQVTLTSIFNRKTDWRRVNVVDEEKSSGLSSATILWPITWEIFFFFFFFFCVCASVFSPVLFLMIILRELTATCIYQPLWHH